jgi:tRNA-2-methylthio-N6-dimethylallyladenosine synthase
VDGMKKLYIKTYGCQMNVYDSSRMADTLRPLGFEATETVDDADMAILNTCHVREKAAEKVYSELGRLRELRAEKATLGQDLVIGVAGCVAQAEGAEMLRRAPYVDIVVGPQMYHKLPELVAQAQRAREKNSGGRGILATDFPLESKFDFLPESTTESTAVQAGAAFLTIQEGCDKFCSFCVVPYTRGAEFSRPVADVLKEAKQLIAAGAKEITLLGQNVNAYHGMAADGSEWGLGRLLFAMAELDGLVRLRYTTSHPRDVDSDLIKAHKEIPALMPFLHLPVQSGSNRMLEMMNRKHSREAYKEVIASLRAARPDIAFSSDFIVGHPRETDQDFNDTLDLVREVNYAQAYSFMYSARAGTPAAMEADAIPLPVKQERLQILQGLLGEQQAAFNKQTEGQIVPVLFEKTGRKAGQIIGRSPFMQSVHTIGNERLIGSIVDVKIVSGMPYSVAGEIVTIETQKVA